MRILLDTHVVVWLAQQPERIPPDVQDAVRTAEVRIISAVSAYEIAFKTHVGKLPQGQSIVEGWDRVRADLIAEEASLTAADMLRAGRLAWDHRDPFDRMLVAQAQAEGLVLVSADAQIRAYPDVRTVWH